MLNQAGGKQRITDLAPNELKLGEGRQSDYSRPSAWRWRRGVFDRHRLGGKIVGSELSECRRTNTLFEYPPGKSLESINKRIKENILNLSADG